MNEHEQNRSTVSFSHSFPFPYLSTLYLSTSTALTMSSANNTVSNAAGTSETTISNGHAIIPPTFKSSYKIASIPGDGIGPEVVSATIEVLKVLTKKLDTFELDITDFDWGTDRYLKTGRYTPEDYLEVLKGFDAILFGSVGSPSVPDHISLWGLRLAICQPLQQYANVRPTRILPGTKSPLANCQPGDLDWVIVRENSEGEYAGQGGRSHVGCDHEVATELSIFTRTGVRRIAQFAFSVAQNRPRKMLTYVTKSNAQRNGMVMWDEVIREVAEDYPDVTVDHMLVDAMTVRMVLNPRSLDTILATNLHADILSDLAAALAGSIGIAPTANLDPTRKNPSMFEPIHGSAFDITGLGLANPVATFWTASEMLHWLGESEAAVSLMHAVEKVCAAGVVTRDLGGNAGTKEVTKAVVQEILDPKLQ
ncbi:putative tartrate dehydrogenase [Lentinula detonsa]|uniref:D-malate dehydrogenase (decarboxylating) n=1 Tax=Lentinula detonsa TaxID=2804962 RepID=A0AA38Q0Q9_9AGAR|nr:putative tartrate dehydrogenase [Lentinula detonsa]